MVTVTATKTAENAPWVLDHLTMPEQDLLQIYPPHWWVGMKNQNLQLLIHAKDIGKEKCPVIKHPGLKLVKTHKVKNPNYVFLDK